MEKEEVKTSGKLVVIGGSSGSLEALLIILPLLRLDISFPIIIILHRNNQTENALVDVLSYKTKLTVKEVDEKDELQIGTIYLAPPDYHLLIENDFTLSLDGSPKVNFSRPSIDVSFVSASKVYKENLVGILLSGANSDGGYGLSCIQNLNGKVAVQNPDHAIAPYMPAQAIKLYKIQQVLSPEEIAAFINNQ